MNNNVNSEVIDEYLFHEENTIDMTSDKGTFRHFVKCALRSPKAVFGFAVLLILILCALFSPVLAPNDPYKVDLMQYLKPPAWMNGGNWQYPLGTDSLGRCVLSRIIYGSRISLLVGTVSVLIAGALGVVLGLVSGYCGKWIDDVIMRIADVFLAEHLVGQIVSFDDVHIPNGQIGDAHADKVLSDGRPDRSAPNHMDADIVLLRLEVLVRLTQIHTAPP